MEKIFAAEQSLGQIGNGGNLGPFAGISFTSGAQALSAVSRIVSSIIGIMTVAAGIWFIFQFLIGGFYWITSGGDKQKLHDARERITNGFVGLLIVIAGWSVLAIAGQFFGYDILLQNPNTIMQQIGN